VNYSTRRDFISNIGKGMLIATVGSALANDLGISSAWANEGPNGLTFGKLEPLVQRMQEMPADKLQGFLVSSWRNDGLGLRDMVAAAALANARKFGGEDYVGFHVIMALTPAYEVSRELDRAHQPLPILKVLYRNTDNILKNGGRRNEVLQPVQAARGAVSAELLREAIRARNMDQAEATFAAQAQGSADGAFNQLLLSIQDDVDVHRVVLAHRAWSLLDFVGEDQAHTMLRESVRYCVDKERSRSNRGRPEPEIRTVLPKLLDEYHLLDKSLGNRRPDDAWIDGLCQTIFNSPRREAAAAVASALADGIAAEDVGEAISLAANQLELRDRASRVHGACAGVHGSDSAHAWRSIARVSNHRNKVSSLIVGAYHISQAGKYSAAPYPLARHSEGLTSKDPSELVRLAEQAIRQNDQAGACAAISRYGELGHPPDAAFGLLRRFAISEDGRLHGEKYYVTVREEFAATRPAFRWRHLVGLARATASGYGYTADDRPGFRAPGYQDACRLLQIKA